MRLATVAYREERVLALTPIGTLHIEDGQRVRLTTASGGVELRVGGYVGVCAPPDGLDAEWLESVTTSGGYLAEFLQLQVPEQHDLLSSPKALLRVLSFDEVALWPEGRQVGLDEAAIQSINRFRRRLDSLDAITKWLMSELAHEGPDAFAVMSRGGGSLDGEAFRLVGATIVADVKLVDERLIITRVTRRPQRTEDRLTLVLGAVTLVDATRMGRLSAYDRAEIARLNRADGAYLEIWKEYNDLEREVARKAASQIGWAEYDRYRVRADGSLEFDLVRHHRSDSLRSTMGSEAVGLEAASGVAFNDEASRNAVIGTARVSHRDTVILRPGRPVDGELPQRGRLSGAYTLDRVRIDRREKAQRQIAEGVSAPARQMSLILADQPTDPVARAKRHDPMSNRVRQLLGGDPTEAQLQAIDLAINSQDILLIQGPPGTGKTRVIAAIQARLAEINKDNPAPQKRVLLTSYQHDAVSNLVQAADDGNLPPVKLGRTEGTADESYLTAWASELQNKLAKRYEHAKPNEAVRDQRALIDRTNAYRQQPFDTSGTVDLLEWIARRPSLFGPHVSLQAGKLAKAITHDLAAATNSAALEHLSTITRRLRSSVDGYADDGATTAAQALRAEAFVTLLGDEQRQTLRMAADDALPPSAAAPSMDAIKRDVLDRLLDARARSGVVATMPEVEALLIRAAQAAAEEVALSTNPVDRVVEEFRDAVEHAPDALRQSIVHHTRALAATCQQAVSSPVKQAQSVPFGTVIIDEAARANPLDLMIPLSLARERAILVGDHRQLPQLLDDSLVPRLSARHDAGVVDSVLRRSLFERLFVKCGESELRDGTKRVVTLNVQFRSHPILGSFISDQFYAPFGERLENASKEPAAFAHHLPAYGNAACGWIDVPHRLGGETKEGTSIARQPEASAIVEELASNLQASTGLTFGVVTFYSGQVTILWEAMVSAGLAIRRGPEYDLDPSVPWLFDERGVPRLRIGSVDAFQGREFDVVYLSITRSRPLSQTRGNPFGFLVLANRLCVAMSRQRRLLIAVGDAALFTSERGRASVPSLAAFHELTGGEYGFRRSA